MPKLSELGRLYHSKLDINPMELKNKKEIKNALNNLIKDIIDDIIKILTLIMAIKKKFIKKKKNRNKG